MRNEFLDNETALQEAVNAELDAVIVPESLSPEQMVNRLKAEKRKGIHLSKKAEFRAIAALCASLILVVSISAAVNRERKMPLFTSACYMDNAGSYHTLYQQARYLIAQNKKARNFNLFDRKKYAIEDAVYLTEEDSAIAIAEMPTDDGAPRDTGRDVSDTITQVDGITEADVVKCDGDSIYYLKNGVLTYLPIADGKFGAEQTVSLPSWTNYYKGDLYLTEQGITVVYSSYANAELNGMVSVISYTHDENGKLVQSGTCCQEGYLVDTRVADGMLYLVSSTSKHFDRTMKESDLHSYVPCCGTTTEEFVEAEDILIPDQWSGCQSGISYTLVSAVDLKTAEIRDNKALAGSSGTIYMTKNAMYLSSYDGDKTRISRISYENGTITPVATTLIDGTPLNQYAMHETEDAFFVAASGYVTISEDGGRTAVRGGLQNFLYSFDLSMKQLDRVSFAQGEQLKAVNYADNFAYIVTFYQTDPLFCIDCTNPKSLKICDEFKVSGYSTFLYPWKEHLFSFGVESNNGMNGIKLMMYDSNENGDLTMLDDHIWAYGMNDNWWWESDDWHDDHFYENFYESPAITDYKSLYIHPEKNLLAVPLNVYGSDAANYYVFMRFNEQTKQFEEIQRVAFPSDPNMCLMRCLSVDNVFYLIADNYIQSVDGNSFEVIEGKTI